MILLPELTQPAILTVSIMSKDITAGVARDLGDLEATSLHWEPEG